jgi:hypothetical protein
VPDQIEANEPWAQVYEFTSSRLAELPIPSALPLRFGRALDELALKMTAVEPSTVWTTRN